MSTESWHWKDLGTSEKEITYWQ